MVERRIPSSILWLGALVVMALATAVAAGAILYVQTRTATRTRAEAITGGNIDRGRAEIERYACGGCHVIPGIAGANGGAGPDLTHVGERSELAGLLRNDPDAMVRWLIHPQSISPHGGMPEQGVAEADARDMAAYLYAQ